MRSYREHKSMLQTFTFDQLKRAVEATRGSPTAAVLLLTFRAAIQTYPLTKHKDGHFLAMHYGDICDTVGLRYDQVRGGMRRLREMHLIATERGEGEHSQYMLVALTDKARGILK